MQQMRSAICISSVCDYICVVITRLSLMNKSLITHNLTDLRSVCCSFVHQECYRNLCIKHRK